MIGTVGIAPSAPSTGVNRSTVALDAQLARYQTELAQWLSCPSCKTPEGKAKVAELSARIGEIEQRIGAAEPGGQRAAVGNGADVAGARSANGDSATAFGVAGTAATGGSLGEGPLGRRLDVHA